MNFHDAFVTVSAASKRVTGLALFFARVAFAVVLAAFFTFLGAHR